MLATGLFTGTTSLKPDCIVGRGVKVGTPPCEPNLYGDCLIAYPPDQPWGGTTTDITLYQPCNTGNGSTGIQMAIVFHNAFTGGDGYYISEEDTEIYPSFVSALGCSHIIVMEGTYEIQYTPEFSNGYVILDITVVELNLIDFSFAGSLHNNILQEITALGSFPHFSKNEAYNVGKLKIETYYNLHNLGGPQIMPYGEFLPHLNEVLSYQDDISGLFTAMKNEGKINQIQLDFLLDICTVCENATDPNVLVNSLFQIRQDVEAFSGLDFNQKLLVYGAAVIGESGAPYWYSAYNNPNSPWHPTIPLAAIPKWAKRPLADLGGWVVGFGLGVLVTWGNVMVGSGLGTLLGTSVSASYQPKAES